MGRSLGEMFHLMTAMSCDHNGQVQLWSYRKNYLYSKDRQNGFPYMFVLFHFHCFCLFFFESFPPFLYIKAIKLFLKEGLPIITSQDLYA